MPGAPSGSIERCLRPTADAAAHLILGFLLIQTGRKHEGQEELHVAVRLDPSLASRIPDRRLVVAETAGP